MSDQVVVVTGGSRGIGAATARRLAAEGVGVVVNYQHDAAAAAAVVADCEALGVRAVAVQADVSDEAQVLTMFDAATSLGRLVGLVNNAGIISPVDRIENYTADRVRRTLEVNVIGAFLCAREAIKALSTSSGGAGGAIVNVSSAASYLGSPNEFIDYAASKGAVDTMTLGLAKEVATQGIRVNAVRPGLIDTEIHAASGDAGRVERFTPGVPLQRVGAPEEVAAAIVWLLSDQASYVTGEFVNVSGGR